MVPPYLEQTVNFALDFFEPTRSFIPRAFKSSKSHWVILLAINLGFDVRNLSLCFPES